MAFTKKELIRFMIGDFERNYEYEKEVQTEITELPAYYIASMPNLVQEKIRQKVVAALIEYGECTPENVERAMCSKAYDLEDLINIRENVRWMEEEQQKKAEQKREKSR